MVTRATSYENLNRMTEAELTRWITSAAKRNNQRLRELESKGIENSSAAYRYVKRNVYDGSKFYTTTKDGRIKFTTSQKGLSFAEKKSLAFELEEFQKAKSSTIKGMEAINEKAAETFERNFGESGVSYSEFSEAMAANIIKDIYNMFGSDVAIEVVYRTRGMTDEEIMEALGDIAGKSATEIFNDIESFQANKQSMDNSGGDTFADDVPL